MSKKVLKNIQLTTAPNGYTLKIDGNEYFYFNEADLLAGFIARIGSESKEMEKEDILNTIFNVMLGQKYARDIDKLNKTVYMLNETYMDRTKKLDRATDQVNDALAHHGELTKKIREITSATVEMEITYKKACKPYEEYAHRINSLEKMVSKMESHFKSATGASESLLKQIEDKLNELTQLELKLKGKADMLIGRLQLNAIGGADMPDVSLPAPEVSNIKDDKKKPAKEPKKKVGRPKKAATDNKTKRSRNKAADEAIRKIAKQREEELEKQLQEHWKNDPNI